MGKLQVILATTLDGFIAGSDGSLDWIVMGDDRTDYVVESLRDVGTLMLGRKTYQGFVSYWPDAATNPAAPVEQAIGKQFNAMRKVVFSRTLASADWPESTLLREIVPEEIRKLKAESERDIRLDGSISIVQQLTRLGLIDEYRLMVHPVALGTGRPLFDERVELQLIGSERFSTGVMVLTYEPAAKQT